MCAAARERDFFWFHSVFGGMGNKVFFDARGFFFASQREFFILVFFWCFSVFLLFFGGVFALFGKGHPGKFYGTHSCQVGR